MLSRFSRPGLVRLVVSAFVVGNVAVTPPAEAAVIVSAADMARIADSMLAFHSGAGARTTSPRWTAALSAVESAARSASAPGFLRSDGSWPDINYAETPSGSWSPWEHFRRITAMVRGYVTPGQSTYRDPALLRSIDASLAYSLTFYNATTPTAGNWWFWRIGVPLDLAPALVLMRSEISPATLDGCTRALRAKMGGSSFYYPGGSLLKGQNLVWHALNHVSLAILQNDTTMMAEVREAMAAATAVSAGDGLKEDSTFHQHGPQLYTGAYGGAFANDVSKYLLLTRGTPVQLPDNRLQLFADYIADGVAWATYQKHWDVSVVGREVARSSTTGYHAMASLLQMTEAASPRQAEIARYAAKMLQSWDWTLPTELAAIASRYESSATPAAWPSGFRGYRASDYVIHRRPTWFASVKMLSNRTKSGESTNGENVLGARQSDGRLHLVLRGDEYYARDVIPTMDWSRLPGTTVEQRPNAASNEYGLGTRSFVGSAGDGRNGVAAMDFAPVTGALQSKKAWVFFDDAIVFFNSGINAQSIHPVETIIEQWPLSSSSTPFLVDGVPQSTSSSWNSALLNPRWAHADRIGYFFPEPITVNAKRSLQSGAWSRLGAGSSSSSDATNPFLTLFVDHGVAPVAASAVYMIVPDISATAMQQWAASAPVQVLANDSRVAAARDVRSGNTGLVFWQPGAFSGVSSDGPALVYITRDQRRVRAAIADPRQGSGSMRITFAEPLTLVSAPIGVTISRDGRSTTLTVPRNGGATAHVELAPATRVRTVRR